MHRGDTIVHLLWKLILHCTRLLHTIEENNLIVAMGILNLKPVDEEEMTMLAFTFLLVHIDDSLKIKVHHSSPI